MNKTKILIVGRSGTGKTYKHLPQTLKKLQIETKGKLYGVNPKPPNPIENSFSSKYWKHLEVHQYNANIHLEENDIVFIDEPIYCNEYPNNANLVICIESLEYAKVCGLEIDDFSIIKVNISDR